MKKILFFSCEPGGAEVLIPVIRLLQEQRSLQCTVLGFGHALERFSRKSVECHVIEPIGEHGPTPLDRHMPDMLITSATSLPSVDMSERYLWRQAALKGVPSLAFLDQWQNYSLRFSGTGSHERLAYLPDWINCLNETGRSEMIEEGFDPGRLLPFGHPYLASLRHDLAGLDPGILKRKLNIFPDQKVLLFVSEAIRENYGAQRGYDQYQVLDYFLTMLAGQNERPKILVKLHPKDRRDSFRELAKKFERLSIEFVTNEMSSLECLAISDLVFGMSSIMLIEAYILGKKVVSLQPGLCVNDPLVLSRHGLIPVILCTDKCNLLEPVSGVAHGRFDVAFDADKLLSFFERVIQ